MGSCRRPRLSAADHAAVQLGDAAGVAQVHGRVQLLGQDVDTEPHADLGRGGQSVHVTAPTSTARAPSTIAAEMSVAAAAEAGVDQFQPVPHGGLSTPIPLVTTRPGISRAALGIAPTAADMTSREWL